jgi:hypothetical protein
MPALSVDGDIYSCFRLLPFSNVDTRKYKQGDIKSGFIKNKKILKFLQEGSKIKNIKFMGNVYNKKEGDKERYGLNCDECKVKVRCGSCASGCFIKSCADFGKKGFVRTTSICFCTKIQSIFSTKYWKEVFGTKFTEEELEYARMLDKQVRTYIMDNTNKTEKDLGEVTI